MAQHLQNQHLQEQHQKNSGPNEMVWIDDSCINCDMCVPECPSEAIAMGPVHYEINNDSCVLCEGFYAHETCIAVCPIGSVHKKGC